LIAASLQGWGDDPGEQRESWKDRQLPYAGRCARLGGAVGTATRCAQAALQRRGKGRAGPASRDAPLLHLPLQPRRPLRQLAPLLAQGRHPRLCGLRRRLQLPLAGGRRGCGGGGVAPGAGHCDGRLLVRSAAQPCQLLQGQLAVGALFPLHRAVPLAQHHQLELVAAGGQAELGGPRVALLPVQGQRGVDVPLPQLLAAAHHAHVLPRLQAALGHAERDADRRVGAGLRGGLREGFARRASGGGGERGLLRLRPQLRPWRRLSPALLHPAPFDGARLCIRKGAEGWMSDMPPKSPSQ
jgi:hypothetical protein